MYRFPEETPTVEPTFTLISSLVKAVCPWPVLLFVIYASIGVTCKIFAIKRLTSLLFLSLVIYISNVYLLHDMTQIRAGVASGIFLLAIRPLAEHKIFRYTALILLAALFHYSSLLLLPRYDVRYFRHSHRKHSTQTGNVSTSSGTKRTRVYGRQFIQPVLFVPMCAVLRHAVET